MAFSVKPYDMPYVPNYQAAQNLFARLTPIRGGDQSVRRYVSRTDRSKLLKQEFENGVEVYAFYYHNTAVVKYYPTYQEIFMGGWDSISTRAVISGVTGRNVGTCNLSDYAPTGFRTAPQEVDAFFNGYPITVADIYKFGYDGKPLEPDALPKLKKFKINRARMKAVRDHYRPFMDYVKAMAPLVDFNNEEVAKSIYGEASEIAKYSKDSAILRCIEDDNMWHAFIVLASTQNRVDWVYNPGKGYSQIVRQLSSKDMLAHFDKVIKADNPEVLDAVEVL